MILLSYNIIQEHIIYEFYLVSKNKLPGGHQR